MTKEMRKLIKLFEEDLLPGDLGEYDKEALDELVFKKNEKAAFDEVAHIIYTSCPQYTKDPLGTIETIAYSISRAWKDSKKSQFLEDEISDAGIGIEKACKKIEAATEELYEAMNANTWQRRNELDKKYNTL